MCSWRQMKIVFHFSVERDGPTDWRPLSHVARGLKTVITLEHRQFGCICLSWKRKLSWLIEQRAYIGEVITKSLFSFHPVSMAVKWWGLLGCNWQISGGLDLWTAELSLRLNWKSSIMSALNLHPVLLCKSSRHWLTKLPSFVFTACHSEDASDGLKGPQSHRGTKAQLWLQPPPFPMSLFFHIYILYRRCVH